MSYGHPESVIEALWRSSPGDEPSDDSIEVFTILDGARDERIYPALLELDEEESYRCLYRGELDEELAAAAPYLLKLAPDDELTHWIVTEGWGQSWGIFLQSAAGLDELRRHFRRFLMVHDHTGKPLYFRYYDPRVLRVYLPTCNLAELEALLGPVRRFLFEDDDPNALLQVCLRNGRPARERQRMALSTAAENPR